MEMSVYKLNFSRDGKVYKEVMLREMKIRDYNTAMTAASGRMAKDAPPWQAEWIINTELLKLLLVSIDGNKPERSKLEDLDSIFSEKEFRKLMYAMKEIRGDDENPLQQGDLEFVPSGEQ